MRVVQTILLLALLAGPVAACSSGTDITREDDDVEQWVAEQKAEERDRKVRRSMLPTPAAGVPTEQPAPPEAAPTPPPAPCSAAWYERVEAKLHVVDAEGHGPDLGSAEWKSAVEHKLGVQEDPTFPELGTPAWCDQVDQRVRHTP